MVTAEELRERKAELERHWAENPPKEWKPKAANDPCEEKPLTARWFKWEDSEWSIRVDHPEELPAGTEITVERKDGSTSVVYVKELLGFTEYGDQVYSFAYKKVIQ